MRTIDEIKYLIISETILEIGIDPTDRLEKLSDDEILKEYKTLLMFSIGD